MKNFQKLLKTVMEMKKKCVGKKKTELIIFMVA